MTNNKYLAKILPFLLLALTVSSCTPTSSSEDTLVSEETSSDSSNTSSEAYSNSDSSSSESDSSDSSSSALTSSSENPSSNSENPQSSENPPSSSSSSSENPSSSSEIPSSSSSSSSSSSEDDDDGEEKDPATYSDTLVVNKVDNLPDDFIFGVDISSVIAEENSGVKYYDYEGNETDIFSTLARSGVNYIRVRIWNDPYDSDGHGYGGGNCDIDVATAIGKRATQYGMKLLVDFHYSDFWADPSRCIIPKAWANYSTSQVSQAIYNFTVESLTTLSNEGIDIGMVQVGNETTNWLAGSNSTSDIYNYLKNGCQAVRDTLPDALVAVHFTNPNRQLYSTFASRLNSYGVDYDVFGSSYYSYWHGTLSNLASELNKVSSTYGKKVMVLETSYPFTTQDSDGHANSYCSTGDYEVSEQGQADCLYDLTNCIVNDVTDGIGICYWEPAWITVGGSSWSANSAKWEQYGSGWASSYAYSYDPDNVGTWYGGSSWDNQALFDASGNPLESLKVFNLMKTGNLIDDNDDNGGDDNNDDNSDTNDSNLISNYSFETGELDPWIVTNNSSTPIDDSTYMAFAAAATSSSNVITGNYSFNFWAQNANVLDLDLTQSISITQSGTYNLSLYLMGAADEQNHYAYVLDSDGNSLGKVTITTSSWSKWAQFSINNLSLTAGETITVGMHLETPTAGGYGFIDDVVLELAS